MQTPTSHENVDDLSFQMKYHTVVYTLYSAIDSQFNNMPIFITIATHYFPLKWSPWQPKSCDISIISVVASIPSVATIGLKLTKLQSEVALFSDIFSKKVILP